MVTKENVGEPFRRIRIPVEARQHLENYKGIPAIDAFYTAGWVSEKDGTFKRYLAPTTHTQAIVLDGGAMKYYWFRGEGVDPDPVRDSVPLLLLTGNPMINSKPEIQIIKSSEENDQFVEYGVDPIDFRIAHEMLGGLGLLREYDESSDASLKRHIDEIRESITKSTRKRSRGA